MQTLIQTVATKDPGWVAGSVLLGVMVLYAVALCYGAFRRVYFEWCQQSLARQLLLLDIKAAKARCQEIEKGQMLWNGFRKFEVTKKTIECEGVTSLYLAPHDKHPLPPFKPGQFLTFQINIPGEAKPVVRCYSLSDSHRPDCYRVTIKKVLPQPDVADSKPGLVSSHFFDRVKQGDILDVKAPSGHFFLDLSSEKPVVLISGGVGVTPMVSMLNAIIDNGLKREAWFFFGVRNSGEHIFKEHLEQAAGRHENVRLHVCYSRPKPEDVSGRDYHHARRVSVELFKELLPSSNYEYFLCGPDAFMETIVNDLGAWGVPKENIHREAFNAVAKVKPAALTASDTVLLSKLKITFGRSGQTVRWNPSAASLLDFAEQHGVKIDAGCRVGNCGTCLIAIKNGAVEYQAETTASAESGSCLACICKPKTDLVIDA